MGKEAGDQLAETARRRLALLGQELAQAGIVPLDAPAGPPDPGPSADPEPDPVPPTVVPEPGRHARSRAPRRAGVVAGWVHDRLPASLQGRVGLGAGHLVVLALVAAAGLAIAAWLTLRAAPEGRVVPVPRPAAALVPASPAGSAGPSAAGSASGAADGTVIVDVAGKVRRPGVTTLPAGSRVVDAIRKAGGPRPGVSLTSLNLARVLVDGEQILVGVAPAPGIAPSAAAAGGADGPLVNLNTASSGELEALPGVGPVTAEKIIAWRTDHGPFTSVDDLLEVDGIGEKTLAELAPHVTL